MSSKATILRKAGARTMDAVKWMLLAGAVSAPPERPFA